MKTSVITKTLGLAALLGSSMALAATITVNPSTLTPSVGNSFTVTLSAVDFVNVGAGTWSMTWDTSKATFVSGVLPATGPVAVGTGSFLITTHQPTFDLLPGSPPIVGSFDFAVFTFNAVAAGAMNLQVFNQAVDGWFDNDTADAIPIPYQNASITIIPAPATLWLLGSGVAGLAFRGVRNKRAVAA